MNYPMDFITFFINSLYLQSIVLIFSLFSVDEYKKVRSAFLRKTRLAAVVLLCCTKYCHFRDKSQWGLWNMCIGG